MGWSAEHQATVAIWFGIAGEKPHMSPQGAGGFSVSNIANWPEPLGERRNMAKYLCRSCPRCND
jgi:hypothetical protein